MVRRIKAGQIYFHKDIKMKLVITRMAGFGDKCDWITKDGMVISADDYDNILKRCKLIAEYPTWLEAVNSPEFNGEK